MKGVAKLDNLYVGPFNLDSPTYKLTALTEQIMIQTFQIVAEVFGMKRQRR